MGKSFKWLFWTILFLLALLAIDQFFVKVPPVHGTHAALSEFYLDFRQRLLGMAIGDQAVVNSRSIHIPGERNTIEKVIDQSGETSTAEGRGNHKTQRFVYSDEQGNLQFAESLKEVPSEYRETAQPMAE